MSAMDEIGALLGPLLDALDGVGWAQRHLYPPMAPRLADQLSPLAARLEPPLSALTSAECPAELRALRDRLADVSRQTVELIGAFAEAARSPGDVIGLYRTLRRFARVQEALYPLAPALDPVSRWFLDPERREDDDLVARLSAGALREGSAPAGVLHWQNERDARGGFSAYVPESWDGAAPMPLVVALHGGSGHGRDFLWSWLAAARSRGALLLSPTAQDRTWSIMGGDDVDAEPIGRMVESVAERYAVDRSRVLLTGMSDGGTYSLLCGLAKSGPFTHLAPVCGVLHPLLLANGGIERARDRAVLLRRGRARLDVPRAVRAAVEGRADDGRGPCHVSRDRGPLPHVSARREPAHPRLADGLVSAAAAGARPGWELASVSGRESARWAVVAARGDAFVCDVALEGVYLGETLGAGEAGTRPTSV